MSRRRADTPGAALREGGGEPSEQVCGNASALACFVLAVLAVLSN